MTRLSQRYIEELEAIQQQGLYKDERVITTPQGVAIKTLEAGEVLNFCANNYLGLANHPDIVNAAVQALHDHGFGMASVLSLIHISEPTRLGMLSRMPSSA